MREIDYLGHTLYDCAVTMDKNKVQAILSWPEPANLKQFRVFLGLTWYYQKFSSNIV